MNVKTNVRETWGHGALAVLLLAAVALALLPAAASAQAPDTRQPVSLAVAGPEDVPLGNLARVVAVLRDGSGEPIADARIVFASPAIFAGTIAEAEIGEAATDKQGTATLDYQLRTEGENQIIARYYGNGGYQPAEASTTVLATGQMQLSQRSVGVHLPVLGAWTLMLVLGGVWSVYFVALLLVAGLPEPRGSGPAHEMGGRS